MTPGDPRTALRLEAEAAIAADTTIPRAAAYLDGFLDASAREVLREVLVQAFLAGRASAAHDRRAALRLEAEAHAPSSSPVVLEDGPGFRCGRAPAGVWLVRPETEAALRELDRGPLGRLWARLVRAVGGRRAC